MTEPYAEPAGEPLDHKFLTTCSTQDSTLLAGYNRAELYYDGAQTTYLTEREKEYLEVGGVSYQENFCETIVDALVERLAIVGVESTDEDLSKWLWTTFYDGNRGDLLQLTTHTESAKKGDAYLIVDWDPTKLIPIASFNPPERIKPMYCEGVLDYVAKWWDTDRVSMGNPEGTPIRRLNLYYPDRVEKFYSLTAEAGRKDQTWERWRDDSDTAWPTAWVTSTGAPRGIPVFHLANKARSTHMGRSELAGTYPQQNRLNKELLDLSGVLDQLGWPQRWSVGLENTTGLKSVPGEVWNTPLVDAKFGQFDAADPEGMLKAIESTLVRIAIRSNTPAHRIVLAGGYPSGEALKVSEAGLVAKVESRQTTLGAVWSDVFRMAATVAIDNAGGSATGPGVTHEELANLSINVIWKDPNTRNEKEHLETLTLMKALGVSTDTLLSMIPGIDAQAEMEKKAAEAEEAVREAQASMAAGVTPGPGTPPPFGGGGSMAALVQANAARGEAPPER